MNKQKFPEGHFVSQYMAIFMPLGIIWGILIEPAFIAVGVAIGFVIGLVVGTSLEERYKNQGLIRPLTKQEQDKKKIVLKIAPIIGIIVAVAFLLVFLF